MGKGIHATASRHNRIHAIGQRRINNRQVRQHIRAAQAHLDTLLRRAKHRIFAHFRAGSCRGRHGDKRQRLGLQRHIAPDHLYIVINTTLVGDQRCQCLPGIQYTSPSDGQYHIRTKLPAHGSHLFNHCYQRLTVNGYLLIAHILLLKIANHGLCPLAVPPGNQQYAIAKLVKR